MVWPTTLDPGPISLSLIMVLGKTEQPADHKNGYFVLLTIASRQGIGQAYVEQMSNYLIPFST